jgi:hypothetical protein
MPPPIIATHAGIGWTTLKTLNWLVLCIYLISTPLALFCFPTSCTVSTAGT